MSYPFEAVWMTTQEHGTPHAQALQAANPNLAIHVSAPPMAAPDDYLHAWRNCDRNIRSWWRVNRDATMKDAVLFLEYDVYCNADLRGIIPPLADGVGIAGPSVVNCVESRRSFWPFLYIPRLPRDMQGMAIAAAPLAVLLISRAALDAALRPEYDAVFADDIFCEVRLPTIIRHAGFQVAALPITNVVCVPQTPPAGAIGIWHPVKHAV